MNKIISQVKGILTYSIDFLNKLLSTTKLAKVATVAFISVSVFVKYLHLIFSSLLFIQFINVCLSNGI